MAILETELQQQELTYIDPETMELYKHIREGTVSVEGLQNRLDREPQLEGFLNHYAFERRLGILLSRGIKGVLVAVDLDSLKAFNDSQGHPAGDELIKIAAKLLHSQTRTGPPTLEQREQRQSPNQPQDLLGRVGGDEFAIFFVGAEMSDAKEAAKRVRGSIVTQAREAFPNYGPEQTMSLGLSEVKPNDTVQALRQRADLALYQAKNGKGSKEITDSIAIN